VLVPFVVAGAAGGVAAGVADAPEPFVEITTVAGTVPLMVALSLALIVPRASRVASALAAATTFCFAVRGVFAFLSETPQSLRI